MSDSPGGVAGPPEPPKKWIAVFHHDEDAAASMLAKLLTVEPALQIDTLAIVMRAFIERREGRL